MKSLICPLILIEKKERHKGEKDYVDTRHFLLREHVN